jgi:hypothetical protein
MLSAFPVHRSGHPRHDSNTHRIRSSGISITYTLLQVCGGRPWRRRGRGAAGAAGNDGRGRRAGGGARREWARACAPGCRHTRGMCILNVSNPFRRRKDNTGGFDCKLTSRNFRDFHGVDIHGLAAQGLSSARQQQRHVVEPRYRMRFLSDTFTNISIDACRLASAHTGSRSEAHKPSTR